MLFPNQRISCSHCILHPMEKCNIKHKTLLSVVANMCMHTLHNLKCNSSLSVIYSVYVWTKSDFIEHLNTD